MLKRLGPPLVVLFVLVARGAMAQEKGQVGLTMGYPTSIGLTWHVSDVFALRPAVTVSHSSSTYAATVSPPVVSPVTTTSTNDSTTWSFTVGAPFYAHKWDKASAYVIPIFGYTHAASTSSGQTSTGMTSVSSSHVNGYSFSGSVGAQYSLSRRFAAFGEAGVAYSHQKSTYTSNETTTKTWGMRSAVGVILYFN